MKLTSDQVSNLCLLADFMEGLNDPNFTMDRFTHNCSTPACALGWACKVPELEAQGLRLEIVDAGGFAATRAAIRIFGDYASLFTQRFSGQIKTPQQWAAHCRAFLKENGYEVKPKSDGFEKFMKKVTEPVDTEQFHPWRTA